jgi:hypothetical protein
VGPGVNIIILKKNFAKKRIITLVCKKNAIFSQKRSVDRLK